MSRNNVLVSSPLSFIPQRVAPGSPTVSVYGSPEFTKETLENWHTDTWVHIDSANVKDKGPVGEGNYRAGIQRQPQIQAKCDTLQSVLRVAALTRQRIMVCMYYRGSHEIENINQVCLLALYADNSAPVSVANLSNMYWTFWKKCGNTNSTEWHNTRILYMPKGSRVRTSSSSVVGRLSIFQKRLDLTKKIVLWLEHLKI